MKKLLALVLLLALCLPLFGCSGRAETLTGGVCRAEGSPAVCVGFSEQEFFFNYSENMLGVSDMTGTYETANGKVICISGGETVVFEIVDSDTVRYTAKGTARINGRVADGMLFHRDQTE